MIQANPSIKAVRPLVSNCALIAESSVTDDGDLEFDIEIL